MNRGPVQMEALDKNNKFKMAAAAILNFIHRSQLVYYLHIFFYKIWQVYYVGGTTCMYAKILNKNKI